ncbi:hypothetical protein FLX27_16285 [Agrobacterium tumefaciens]|nr:hypothetical protein [Agrobacterium tumefaciens]TQN60593.1 hypothetical protein FLX27_16285 [Agrobacterium tumefaciens]
MKALRILVLCTAGLLPSFAFADPDLVVLVPSKPAQPAPAAPSDVTPDQALDAAYDWLRIWQKANLHNNIEADMREQSAKLQRQGQGRYYVFDAISRTATGAMNETGELRTKVVVISHGDSYVDALKEARKRDRSDQVGAEQVQRFIFDSRSPMTGIDQARAYAPRIIQEVERQEHNEELDRKREKLAAEREAEQAQHKKEMERIEAQRKADEERVRQARSEDERKWAEARKAESERQKRAEEERHKETVRNNIEREFARERSEKEEREARERAERYDRIQNRGTVVGYMTPDAVRDMGPCTTKLCMSAVFVNPNDNSAIITFEGSQLSRFAARQGAFQLKRLEIPVVR